VSKKNKVSEPHLCVFSDKSILVNSDGTEQVFAEGRLSKTADARLAAIRKALADGFLETRIVQCKKPEFQPGELNKEHEDLLQRLVASVTSEVGRAVVGLSVLQLCVKCICPEQSIRLHKGSSVGFSWVNGIPMRTLDKNYITPTLRKFDLMRLNADGFMMTRSLAENYPYTNLYKAAIRGAKNDWLSIVDAIEGEILDSHVALNKLLSLLINRSAAFVKLANETLSLAKDYLKIKPAPDSVIAFLKKFVSESSYSARVFEIAIHSLYQALEDNGAFDGSLKPLSQMRSANKKHGNVGDIEITIPGSSMAIKESWDAKYGKSYLRDELEELNDKLCDHPETEVAGFVVDSAPNLKDEITSRVAEIEALYNVKISLDYFDNWVKGQMERVTTSKAKLAADWLIAFAESLCQRRRNRAPIDEPCDIWVQELNLAIKKARKA